MEKKLVFRKYKDKDHPAFKNANKKATKELRKANHKFEEKKLAEGIKQDKKSFYAYTRSKSTRSSADADNGLDAFSGHSRSTNMVPFLVHCDFSLSM